jgi:2-C-methyl-D-erythritol 4-phosphate cytidylyltransferase
MSGTEIKPYTAAIIPSAGMGLRMGSMKKNYMQLAGKPVLAHTLAAFEASPFIDTVIVVAAPEDVRFCTDEIIKPFGIKKVGDVIPGGEERQDSVANALKVLKDGPAKLIVVHDGARPLVTSGTIEDTLKAAAAAGAAIAAVKPKDTIKEAGADGSVMRTVPRETLRLVQTPQAFLASLLFQAFDKAAKEGYTATDESSLVERLGVRVRIVEGSYENIKITTPEDLLLAEGILKKRSPTKPD